MLYQTQPSPVTELLGDLLPFIEQLGSPAVLFSLTSAAPLQHITTPTELRQFLQGYHSQILQPCELPAIQRAFNHAARNELRELIAFDQELGREAMLQNFVSASRRIGQMQLQRLRPLRDHRLVQRYLAAVEKGEATGWHTLVYGMTLAIYSVPLRQGLVGYARQTTRGFIRSAARSFRLSETESNNLLEELTNDLPATVDGLVAPIG